MKKIFTLSAFVLITVFLTSCVKHVSFNENYWLSKERGEVVYSSSSCPYYLVETVNGYAVVGSYGSQPYVGDVLYGDFSYFGTRDAYNRTEGIVVSADVKERWLSYSGAQDAIDYYCY